MSALPSFLLMLIIYLMSTQRNVAAVTWCSGGCLFFTLMIMVLDLNELCAVAPVSSHVLNITTFDVFTEFGVHLESILCIL